MRIKKTLLGAGLGLIVANPAFAAGDVFFSLKNTDFVVLLAFLLLPRLPALWSLPGNSVGKSGLSEQLRPGELASLVQSGGLAARVELPGGLPAPGHPPSGTSTSFIG